MMLEPGTEPGCSAMVTTCGVQTHGLHGAVMWMHAMNGNEGMQASQGMVRYAKRTRATGVQGCMACVTRCVEGTNRPAAGDPTA